MTADYYKVLNVAEEATDAEIKKNYRRLAKKYHPDRHKGDKKAEARFKEISEANAVLSDSKKRAEYDTIRKYGPAAAGAYGATGGSGVHGGFGFGGNRPGGFDFSQMRQGAGSSFQFEGNIEDILGQLFGGGINRGDPFGQARRQSIGADVIASISITFMEAIKGTKKLVKFGNGKKIRITIPAGIEDSKTIRLVGQGEPDIYGGKNGNLIITVRVMEDKKFTRKGSDIHTFVEIAFDQAILGCKKNVKTLTKSVSITIPPGTQPGTKLRLKGIGLDVSGKKGDLYVEVRVTIPTKLSDKQKKLLEGWGE